MRWIADIELTLVKHHSRCRAHGADRSFARADCQLTGKMWPYVLSGMIIILVFWSRVVLHILTVIRWPLEFGH
jgi:hypothetical protein